MSAVERRLVVTPDLKALRMPRTVASPLNDNINSLLPPVKLNRLVSNVADPLAQVINVLDPAVIQIGVNPRTLNPVVSLQVNTPQPNLSVVNRDSLIPAAVDP
jgi:hypothetical protein